MTPKQARDVLRSSNLTGESLLALLDQVVPIVVNHAEQTATQASQDRLTSTGWDSPPACEEQPRAAML